MNSNRFWLTLFAAAWMGCCVPGRAVDWTTTDGKTYHDVKLIRLDADAVTILYTDGGARIPLANLPANLQQRFGYDPEVAKAAADAREKAAAIDAKALQDEIDLAAAQRQAGTEPTARDAATADSPTTNVVASPTPIFTTGTHHVLDEIDAPAGSLRSAPDAPHHTMDEMSQSATAMRPHLYDPTYHTMAHAFYVANHQGLGPDPSDPKHHTMDEAAASAAGQR